MSEANLKRVRALNEIAKGRGQTLAQMAIAWVLRDQRVTSALIGARNVEQLDDSLDALKNLAFTDAELKEIDKLRPGRRPRPLEGRARNHGLIAAPDKFPSASRRAGSLPTRQLADLLTS